MDLNKLLFGQARGAKALASAPVINPVNLPTPLAELQVTVSMCGAWIKAVMPAAHPPPTSFISSFSGSNKGAVLASLSENCAPLTFQNSHQLPADHASVRRDTVNALSLSAPKAGAVEGGSYNATAAFN